MKQRKKQNRKHSEEFKQYLRELSTGRIHTQEAKDKISQSKLGKKHTPEQRKRISEGKKGQKAWNKGISLSEQDKMIIRWNNLNGRFKELINHNYMYDLVDNFEINKLIFLLRDNQYTMVISFLLDKLQPFKNKRGVSEDYQEFTKKLRKLKNDLSKIDTSKIKEVS